MEPLYGGLPLQEEKIHSNDVQKMKEDLKRLTSLKG